MADNSNYPIIKEIRKLSVQLNGKMDSIIDEGLGPDVSGVTATAGHVLQGASFVNSEGQKVNGTIPKKSAQTYTPGTAAQTIPAGVYLNGAQTIAGDADLVPANIKKGVNVFGVTGALPSVTINGQTPTENITFTEKWVECVTKAISEGGFQLGYTGDNALRFALSNGQINKVVNNAVSIDCNTIPGISWAPNSMIARANGDLYFLSSDSATIRKIHKTTRGTGGSVNYGQTYTLPSVFQYCNQYGAAYLFDDEAGNIYIIGTTSTYTRIFKVIFPASGTQAELTEIKNFNVNIGTMLSQFTDGYLYFFGSVNSANSYVKMKITNAQTIAQAELGGMTTLNSTDTNWYVYANGVIHSSNRLHDRHYIYNLNTNLWTDVCHVRKFPSSVPFVFNGNCTVDAQDIQGKHDWYQIIPVYSK